MKKTAVLATAVSALLLTGAAAAREQVTPPEGVPVPPGRPAPSVVETRMSPVSNLAVRPPEIPAPTREMESIAPAPMPTVTAPPAAAPAPATPAGPAGSVPAAPPVGG